MRNVIRRLFVAVGVMTLAGGSALAQSATELQGEALLRALLEEIRLLRTTIQKNAATDLRARVLLERVGLQQQIVRELQREMEQRSLEADYRMEMEPFEEIIANTEERLRVATDSETRRGLEQELLGIRKRREMMNRQRERMETRRLRQEERLAEETARLRGIEDELQRLETSLAGSQ